MIHGFASAMRKMLLILSLPLLFLGCATTGPNAEFVKTVTFSSLEDFGYKHTLISGMEFRESEKLLIEELSEKTAVSEMEARGFDFSASDADFYLVTKWRKAVSSYPDMFDHIDGPMDSLNRRGNPSYRFASRLHLTVEIYETATGNVFWRKDLPNIFDAVQLTEERVVESMERALEYFPERIEKDPNLPDIE